MNHMVQTMKSTSLKLSKSVETIACNICGSKDYKVIHEGIPMEGNEQNRYKSSGNEVGNDRIVKCLQCGLMYVNPRLKPELIFKGYSEGSDETFVSQAPYRVNTFKRSLKQVHKLLPAEMRARLGTKNKPKILDVGTAGGSFLKAAKDAGWDVYGIEPNKWLCNWAKKNYGIKVDQGDLFTQKYKDKSFDVVTLWDVLEHVPDPKKVLIECNRILRPGGVLVVNYPDMGSSIAKLMGRKWVFILTVHLFYFTPKTIRKILNITGFDVMAMRPHIQRLSMGYLAFRMKPYSEFLHKVSSKVVSTLRMGSLEIPYWLGQTLVVAKKQK